MKGQPEKHHYLPVFLLKKWAAQEGRLVEFSRPNGNKVKPRRVYPAQTGYTRNLYSLRGFPDEISQQVEKFLLSPVDSNAAAVLDKLRAGTEKSHLSEREISAWSRFLVSLMLRMPEDIDLLKKRWAEKLDVLSKEMKLGKKMDTDAYRHNLFSHSVANPPVNEFDEDVFNIFIGLISEGKTIDHISSMHWIVLDYSKFALEFYLSDRPIVRLYPLGATNGLFIFPIGPNHLFLAANSKLDLNRISINKNIADMKDANRFIVSQAKRFAYSSTDGCIRFMQNHFATYVEPRSLG